MYPLNAASSITPVTIDPMINRNHRRDWEAMKCVYSSIADSRIPTSIQPVTPKATRPQANSVPAIADQMSTRSRTAFARRESSPAQPRFWDGRLSPSETATNCRYSNSTKRTTESRGRTHWRIAKADQGRIPRNNTPNPMSTVPNNTSALIQNNFKLQSHYVAPLVRIAESIRSRQAGCHLVGVRAFGDCGVYRGRRTDLLCVPDRSLAGERLRRTSVTESTQDRRRS